MLQQAPSVIRDEVAVKVSHIRTVLTPLLERYDFDLKRVRREGSAAEQAALFQAPPVETQKAQEAQYAYDDRTCGTAPSPRAADVVFAVSPASTAFCDALKVLIAEFDKVASSRFDPDVMRELVTGDGFTEALDGLDAAAPVAIAADVEADTEWFRTRWSDVLARHSYDLRGIYLDGTPDDLSRVHPHPSRCRRALLSYHGLRGAGLRRLSVGVEGHRAGSQPSTIVSTSTEAREHRWPPPSRAKAIGEGRCSGPPPLAIVIAVWPDPGPIAIGSAVGPGRGW